MGSAPEARVLESSPPVPPASLAASPGTGGEVGRSGASKSDRVKCRQCGATSVHYCPFCQLPHVPFPEVHLPLDVDVVFCDRPQKATGLHAKLVAPRQVRIVDLFTDAAHKSLSGDGLRALPEYDPATTLLGYPGPESLTFSELPPERLRAARRLIVIDSPWKKSHGLQADPRLACLPRVQLGPGAPASRFWRYHAEGDAKCLSTIEAVSALLHDAHIAQQSLQAAAPSASAADAVGAAGAVAAASGAVKPAFVEGLLHFFELRLRSIGEACSRNGGHDPTSQEAKEERRLRRAANARRAGASGAGERSRSPAAAHRRGDGEAGPLAATAAAPAAAPGARDEACAASRGGQDEDLAAAP